MKKALFFVCYFLSPVLPVVLYLRSIGGPLDSYAVSVILGIGAYVFICNQFILASRPNSAIQALGLKGLLSFHGTMPVVLLVMAAVHNLLKGMNGLGDDTLQTSFGGAAFALFTAVIVFSVLFMANTFVMKIPLAKSLKNWVYAKTGLTYKRSRMLHNGTVIAAAAILVHVFLASSSSFSANPAGIACMAAWMCFSLVYYFGYRLKGRSVKGNL
jgi:predicted ferric reductase